VTGPVLALLVPQAASAAEGQDHAHHTGAVGRGTVTLIDGFAPAGRAEQRPRDRCHPSSSLHRDDRPAPSSAIADDLDALGLTQQPQDIHMKVMLTLGDEHGTTEMSLALLNG